jgi:hypothetical protein
MSELVKILASYGPLGLLLIVLVYLLLKARARAATRRQPDNGLRHGHRGALPPWGLSVLATEQARRLAERGEAAGLHAVQGV